MARALAGWEGENAMKLVDRLLLWVLSLLAVVLSPADGVSVAALTAP